MYKVVLLRHGESEWNRENRFTGWTDVDLSEKGLGEAKAAGNLLKISGAAQVTAAGSGPAGLCTLWRYRAAGGQFLQIEQWPDKVRMLAGASVHLDMLEIRPATPETQ